MTNPQKIRCAALLYHHVGPLTAGMYPKMSIEPRQFERQVGWLKRRGYASILPSDWLTWHSGTAVLPEKPVMITFDDAYADIAEYALPVLKHYGFTATIFVVTERVGATNSWDTQNGYASLPLMTKEQILRWSAEGFAFDAHGRTHRDLTKLDDAALANEIAGSASDLEELLGTPTTSFAYPYGAWNDLARSIAAKHFPIAFSCISGMNTLATDPHLLRRVLIPTRASLLDFALSVRTGGLHRAGELRIRLALRTRLRSLFGK